MRVYTIHIHPRRRDPDRDVVLVKEGFCWPAFFFSVIWAIWKGLWGIALLFLVLEIALGLMFDLLLVGPLAQVALGLLLSLGIGFFANDLRRWTLTRRGFRDGGIVVERSLLSAERRLFERNPDLTTDLLA